MELAKCVESRRSVRKFTSEKIDEALIQKLVATASYAPSWKNAQTTRYMVIRDEKLKGEIAENGVMGFAQNQKVIEGAPCLVLVNTIAKRSGYDRDGSPSTTKGSHWESFDAGIAAQTFCLAAWDAGLGAVILGIYDEEKIGEMVGLPDGHKISALIAMGFPAEEPTMPKRKSVDDLLCFR